VPPGIRPPHRSPHLFGLKETTGRGLEDPGPACRSGDGDQVSSRAHRDRGVVDLRGPGGVGGRIVQVGELSLAELCGWRAGQGQYA
jgi:hypothetical protein